MELLKESLNEWKFYEKDEKQKMRINTQLINWIYVWIQFLKGNNFENNEMKKRRKKWLAQKKMSKMKNMKIWKNK